MRTVILVLVFVSLCLLSTLTGASLAEILLYDELTGYWQVIEESIPSVGEEKTLQFVLHSSETHSKLSPQMEVQDIKALYIRLLDGNVDIFIAWNEDLGETTGIAYRFDDEEEEESIWYKSVSRESLFFPRLTEDSKAFVERLLAAESFEVRVIPEDQGIRKQVFDVRGLGKTILPYLHYFGWEDLKELIEAVDASPE